MNFVLQKSELRDIYEKVAAGQRVSETDALRLFQSKDIKLTTGRVEALVFGIPLTEKEAA